MTDLQDRVAEQPQNGGKWNRTLNDGRESLGELRQFLSEMQGKSPQAMLGAVANSGLIRSTLTAAVGVVVVLFATSAGAYYWGQAFKNGGIEV